MKILLSVLALGLMGACSEHSNQKSNQPVSLYPSGAEIIEGRLIITAHIQNATVHSISIPRILDDPIDGIIDLESYGKYISIILDSETTGSDLLIYRKIEKEQSFLVRLVNPTVGEKSASAKDISQDDFIALLGRPMRLTWTRFSYLIEDPTTGSLSDGRFDLLSSVFELRNEGNQVVVKFLD